MSDTQQQKTATVLTEAEKSIIKSLAEAWKKFVVLPNTVTAERNAFQSLILQAQAMVLAKPVKDVLDGRPRRVEEPKDGAPPDDEAPARAPKPLRVGMQVIVKRQHKPSGRWTSEALVTSVSTCGRYAKVRHASCPPKSNPDRDYPVDSLDWEGK